MTKSIEKFEKNSCILSILSHLKTDNDSMDHSEHRYTHLG